MNKKIIVNFFQETPQRLTNDSDLQNRQFENEVSMQKNVDKNNFNKKSSPQSLSRIYNKSVTQGKRETQEASRKTPTDTNQYDAQDYKGEKFSNNKL